MDRCPTEIWIRIFTLACTDGGFTGRSLSCTSKYIRDASRSVKLQSIAVIGSYEVNRLADALESRLPEHRRILHLCIGAYDKGPSDTHRSPPGSLSPSELRDALISHTFRRADVWRSVDRLSYDARVRITLEANEASPMKVFMHAVDRVLRIASTDLQTFTLETYVIPEFGDVNRLGIHGDLSAVLADYAFPRLEELTMLNARLDLGSSSVPHQERCPVFPSLKRLHVEVEDSSDSVITFLGSAPSLTHLRMSGPTELSGDFFAAILELFDRGVATTDQTLKPSPTKIQRVIIGLIGPTSTFGVAQMERIRALDQMTLGNDKLTLLRSDYPEHAPYGFSRARQDWLQRIEGGDGCWGI
ncbi:hypothetical protein DAEQUDRAFT_725890 [Daedalea quercina L-15889]|uniref:F-box domain-containing protein n=1 Tax=Daedalea quercina L-15889 TaxID=1314783 RepID=A0A165QTU4_9APHY|nr:hypothetical protein DAEQUDRAFT_725890 [Daedalea quercina L-15889]